MKRREFLKNSAIATGAISLPFAWGCNKKDEIIEFQPHFKYLEVSGTNYEVGQQIGAYFSKEIKASQYAIGGLINSVNQIVQASPEVFYTPFIEAAQNHFPDYVDELQGIADGAGLTFQQIMIANIFMEVIYLYYSLSPTKNIKAGPGFGCSTIAYSNNGKLFLGHNEDLFTSFLSNMYVLKIKIPSKPEFMCLSYPGILPGVPPGMNEAGIIQSGNDICGLAIAASVPMVFHFRSVFDATSLDDAVDRASYPHRARTMTHNIGSVEEQKIISVEAAPSKNQSHLVNGFFVHTNHFVLDNMLDIQIDPDGLPSSESRYNILSSLAANNTSTVNPELITGFMSSHESDLPPCVHDHNGSSTLAHSLFDFDKKAWNLYFSNPCLKNDKTYTL